MLELQAGSRLRDSEDSAAQPIGGVQVCALQWNPHEREILSSHGFSQNQLCLWKYPSLAKVGEFKGHSARVLHMAQARPQLSISERNGCSELQMSAVCCM